VYLATSDDLQGLVVQGRTISDTVEDSSGRGQKSHRIASMRTEVLCLMG